MATDTSTTDLLATLDTFSGSKLTHRDDLGLLIETARKHSLNKSLEELSFLAKFVSRAYGIMKRIGMHGEGYDTVAKEFSVNLENAKGLLRKLLSGTPIDVRRRFDETYLAMTATSVQNLLDLLYDLSWYKNWLIDHRPDRRETL